MQSNQIWDSDKGSVIGDDELAIASICDDILWWEIANTADQTGKPKVEVYVSNITSHDKVPLVDDGSISIINTKKGADLTKT